MSRRIPLRRAVVAVAALALGATLVTSSAATLGGLDAETLGGARADVRGTSAVELQWNTDVAADEFLQLHDVTVRDVVGALDVGTIIEVTATDGSASCTSAAATTSGPETLVTFPACSLALLDLTGVHAVATGDGQALLLDGNLGDLHGTIAAFSGEVDDPIGAASRYDTVEVDGVVRLSTLSVDVPGSDAANVVGSRVLVAIETSSGEDVRALFTVGEGGASGVTTGAGAAVTLDLTAILDDLPRASDVVRYSVVLVGPHLLSAVSGAYAMTTAGATIDVAEPTPSPSPTPPPQPAGSALDAVAITPGFSYERGPLTWQNGLGFCHTFTVTNVSASGQWEVSFDTNLPPLWGTRPEARGMDPLKDSFDAATGIWTLRSTQKPLAVGETQQGHYCIDNVTAPDPDSLPYETRVFVSSMSSHYVHISVEVTTSSEWRLPWVVDVDLANFVCPVAAIPEQVHSGLPLERLGSTTYRITAPEWAYVSRDAATTLEIIHFGPVAGTTFTSC